MDETIVLAGAAGALFASDVETESMGTCVKVIE